MFIPDPDFHQSRIPDPKTATKKRGEKIFVIKPFFVFHKIVNYFIFEMLKKKVCPNFQRIIYGNFLPKKLSLSSQKYGFGIRDPRFGIRKKPIPDPGVKKAPDPESATLL